MKKSLFVLIALILCCMLFFTACGDKATTGTDGAEQTTASPEPEIKSMTFENRSEADDLVQSYILYYNDEGNVTEVVFALDTIPGAEQSSESNIDHGQAFDVLYRDFKTAGETLDLTAKYEEADGESHLEASIRLTSEEEAEYVKAAFFRTCPVDGKIIKIEDAEYYLTSAGYPRVD